MAFKGPSVPHRTPRTRALEIGTDASGFVESPDYNAQGGHPTGEGMPRGEYKEPAPGVTNAGARPIQGKATK